MIYLQGVLPLPVRLEQIIWRSTVASNEVSILAS